MPKVRCSVCGQLAASLVRELTDVPVGSRSARVEVEQYRCDACGESTLSPEQMDAAQRAASAVIRSADGLLMPDEILAIRTRYGLTQAQFEQLLGVGPKTVARWERGTVFQNRATDVLIRLVDRVPDVLEHLAHAHGVTLAPRAVRRADHGVPTRRPPTSPGEMVRTFLEDLSLTQAAAAAALDLTPTRLNEIVNDKRAITPNAAIRLAGYFGTSAEFWLNVQIRWDLWRDLQAHPDTYRTVAKRRPKAVRNAVSA